MHDYVEPNAKLTEVMRLFLERCDVLERDERTAIFKMIQKLTSPVNYVMDEKVQKELKKVEDKIK